TTKKISHTRRSPKDRNYPSTPFDKLPFFHRCIHA
ncbi:conjugal transfer protein TraA, partial [Oenococcus oeni]